MLIELLISPGLGYKGRSIEEGVSEGGTSVEVLLPAASSVDSSSFGHAYAHAYAHAHGQKARGSAN